MPNRLIDFVAYWRSRGYTLRQGFKLWIVAQANARITEGDLRWARQ